MVGPTEGSRHHRHRGRRRDRGAPRATRHGPGPRGQRHDLPGRSGIEHRHAIRSCRSTPALGTTRCDNLRSAGRAAWSSAPVPTSTSATTTRETVYGARSWSRTAPTPRSTSSRPAAATTWITSGAPGVANDDVISTGAGSDTIIVRGARPVARRQRSGPRLPLPLGCVDGRPRRRQQSTRRASDRGRHRAHLDGRRHVLDAGDPGEATSPSSAPTRDEDAQHLTAPSATWPRPPRSRPAAATTASACENYLPASVDLGDGYDSLTYLACHRAYVALDVSAECLTAATVPRSPRPSRASSPSTAARPTVSPCKGATAPSGSRRLPGTSWSASGPGADRVFAFGGRITQVIGGRGDDRIKGVGRRGVILNGGRGADVLRGDSGPDRSWATSVRTSRGASRARTNATPRYVTAASKRAPMPVTRGFFRKRPDGPEGRLPPGQYDTGARLAGPHRRGHPAPRHRDAGR